MITLLIKIIDQLSFRISTYFENVNVLHLSNQVWNIDFIQNDLVCSCGFLGIFDITNGQQKLGAWVKNNQLGFSLLMNAWVITHFSLIDKSVDHRNEFLRFTQEDLIGDTWSINELKHGVHHQWDQLECSEIRENVIAHCVDDVNESSLDFEDEIDGSDFLLVLEVFFIILLSSKEHLCWLVAAFTHWV